MSTTQVRITGYRLGPQQARAYNLHQQLDTPRAIHCIAGTRERVDIERLEAALKRITERHEILRTTYQVMSGSGTALQVIEPEVSIQADVLDLMDADENALVQARDHWYTETFTTPFDIESGPPIRCRVARLADREDLIVLSFPSVSADAESAVLCMREVFTLLEGGTPPDPPAQYAQYADYQINWLQSGESAAGREFWKTQTLPVAGRLAAATGSPAARSFTFETIEAPVEISAVRRADEAAEAFGISIESLLLTCWARVLAAFQGTKEVVTRIATSARSFDDVLTMPGVFIRYLPVRVSVQDTDHVKGVWQSCELAMADARAYADSADAESFDHPALFEYFDTRDDSTGSGWRIIDLRGATERFEYRFFALRTNNGLSLRFDFDRNVLDIEAARWIASALRSAVESAATNVAARLLELPLLAGEDRTYVLEDWNRTTRAWPDKYLAHERIAQKASEHPEAIALDDGVRQITYAELDRRANALCLALCDAGAAPETIVAVCAAPSAEAVIAIMAVMKSGAAFLPLDPTYPAERLSYMLRDSSASILISGGLISGDESARLVTDKIKWVDLDRIWPEAEAIPQPLLTADHIAYVIYTSGSTGLPKGTSITHGGLANYLHWCLQEYVGDKATGAPLVSSLAFDLSITSLLGPLCAGQRVTLSTRSRIEALPDILRRSSDFSWIKLTPSHARMLAQQIEPSELEGVARKLILGGEALAGRDYLFWTAASPGLEVINEYGPTEAVVGCATFRASGTALPSESIPIGAPIANVQMYVLDDSFEPVPPGVTGEIHIGGAGLARGYLGRSALTADRFIPHPFSRVAGARLYRTGDLGSYRPDGALLFLGRSDQQVKIRGYRIELTEIEAVLAEHPRVLEAVAVVAGPDSESERLAAYFVPDLSADGDAPSVSELQEYLATRLPEYMIPSLYIAIDQIPLTTNGKIDRQALPAPDGDSTSGSTFELPRTLEEEVLASIFCGVLGLERVSVEENYFALGGDSIRAIRVIGRAAARGINIRIEDLFRHQTVRSLARAARQSRCGAIQFPQTAPFSLISDEDRTRLPEDAVDAYPLSRLQAGMLFHREYHPESAIYHDIFGYHIRMPLDLDVLKQAAAELVARHPALRTSFHLGGYGEPLQVVHETAPNPLHVADISHLSTEEQEHVIQEWMEQEKRNGFAYNRAPLVKFQIHVRGKDTMQFSLSFHHAIIDGWSDASMLVQLAVSYYYHVLGKTPDIAAPKTLYRDFIALERQALESAEHHDFWMKRLEGAQSLVLPRWEATPVVAPSTRGVYMQPVMIPNEVSERLQQVARSMAVPLKNVLLAAHIRVMSFLGGTNDVLTTISSAGRPETEDGDGVLGLHLNSTPFRLELTSGAWSDLIQEALNTELDALPYRRFPLAEIQKLKGSRRISETSFYYTHYHVVGRLQELPEFEILGRIFYEETSFALVANFSLDPWTEKVMLGLACDRTQFGPKQMQFMAGCYERVLGHIALNPDASYDDVELIGETEALKVGQLLTGEPLQESEKTNVIEAIETHARATPQMVALRCGDQLMTYGEMNRQANRLARRLASAGVSRKDVIGIYLSRSIEAVVAMLAVMKAGAAYLPLDPSYPDNRLSFVLEDAGASLVLTTSDLASRLPDWIGRLSLEGEQQFVSQMDDTDLNLPSMSTDSAYCIYTSGSSGHPKGVPITHGNLWASTAARLQYYREPVGSYLMLPSFAFDSSVAGIYWALCTGGTLVIATADEQRDPVNIAGLIDQHHVTHVLSLPSVYSGVLASLKGRGSSLRIVVVAGEACPTEVWVRHAATVPQVALFNEYGPTEATVWSTVERCEGTYGQQILPIGRPIPGVTLRILDASLHPVPIGAAGELFVAGQGIASGYMRRPALTAERFLPEQSIGPTTDKSCGLRAYRTGDRVRLRSDGRIEFLGRVDQQVKIRGHRVELGEIETVIQENPNIMECAVIAQEDTSTGIKLVAYVSVPIPRPGLEALLRAHVEARLPAYMWPVSYSFLELLPRTPNGKLDRVALASVATIDRREPAVEYAPPGGAIESCLADIWADVLKMERVGVEDDFFALGGDSILCIQLIAKAQDAGYRLLPRQIFEGKTIRKIAAGLQLPSPAEQAATPHAAVSAPPGISETELHDFIDQITSGTPAGN